MDPGFLHIQNQHHVLSRKFRLPGSQPYTEAVTPSSPGGLAAKAPFSPGESDSHTLCSSAASAAAAFPPLPLTPLAVFRLIIPQT